MPSNGFKIAKKVQAVDTECYARNLVVTNKNANSAFKKIFGRKTRSSHLKIFVCVVAHSETFKCDGSKK